MKINAVFIPKEKFKKFNVFASENRNRYPLTVFLSGAIVVGVIVFIINKNNNNLISTLSESFSEFIAVLSVKNKLQIFLVLFKNSTPYILFMLFFAFSAIGDVLIYLISFIKFAGMGAYTAFLYTQYGISGIKYFFIVFMPGKILFVIASLILIDICIKSSRDFRQKNRLPSFEIKSSVIRLLFVFLLIFISLCIDSLAVHTFLPLSGISLFL